MAAATKRLLLVYQEPPAPLEEFLSPNLIDWRITPDLGIDIKREVAKSRVHYRYDTRRHRSRLDDDIRQAHLWNTADRVVTIATNLPFSHEPSPGSGGAPRLPPARVGTPVQSLVMRALFKLSPGLEEATNEALASVGVRPGQPYLAAHLRLGGQVGERQSINRHAVKGKSALVQEAEHCGEHIVAARLGNSTSASHATAAPGSNSSASLAPVPGGPSETSNSSAGAASTAKGGALAPGRDGVPFILLTDNMDLRNKAVKKELGRWLSPDVTPVHYRTQALPSKGHRRRGRSLLASKSKSSNKRSPSSKLPLSLELLFQSSAAANRDRKLISKSRYKSKSKKSSTKKLSSKELLKHHLASMADFGIMVQATCLIQSRSGFSHAAYLLGAQRCAAVLEPDEGVDAPMCPIPKQ